MSVNISGTFSKSERPRNGLVAIEDQLVDEQLLGAQYLVVATVSPKFFKTSAEDGTRVPTVKVDHIEVLTGDLAETAKAMLAERYKDRTGLDDGEQPDLFGEFDGEREVPEASAEELLAERAEAKAGPA